MWYKIVWDVYVLLYQVIFTFFLAIFHDSDQIIVLSRGGEEGIRSLHFPVFSRERDEGFKCRSTL